MRITGTFLDEITHDIPSQNWGREDWRREFQLYRRIGIDTVIIIRSGYRDKCIFPSRVIPNLLPVADDLADMFFDLAEEAGLGVWVGTYDSGSHWWRRSWWKEVDVNKAFLDEFMERYGDRKAFAGWYLTHETSRNDSHIIELFNHIGGHCRQLKDVPILISPFPQGSKQFGAGDTFTMAESFDHWERIFEATKGSFDICAFQDGQIQYSELDEFHAGIKSLADRYGITLWSNIESFDRDMPIKFPPADWRYLRYKTERASRVAEKLITFEFAHFMSPHSVWPSAHNLFRRYCEHHGIEDQASN
ncbi:MAG: DUF4434 domain-containing protein [Fimbriimonadaceae bacterium]|nr:DUF4434 domain-containing protein [Fimbriimonadaceae bacterium]